MPDRDMNGDLTRPALAVPMTEREAETILLLTEVEAQRDELLRLAREATNGWACYATRKVEQDEIARLHAAITKAEGK
jgi:hypothetical protein